MTVGPLERSDVRLRPLGDEDADDLYVLHNDLELKALAQSYPLPVSRGEVKRWMSDLAQRSDDATWGIVDLAKDEFVGVVRLMGIDWRSRKAELGIYLASGARNRGIGSQTLELLREWSFGYLGLRRLSARVLASNEAGVQFFTREGFAIEGTLREDAYIRGRYENVVILGLMGPN